MIGLSAIQLVHSSWSGTRDQFCMTNQCRQRRTEASLTLQTTEWPSSWHLYHVRDPKWSGDLTCRADDTGSTQVLCHITQGLEGMWVSAGYQSPMDTNLYIFNLCSFAPDSTSDRWISWQVVLYRSIKMLHCHSQEDCMDGIAHLASGLWRQSHVAPFPVPAPGTARWSSLTGSQISGIEELLQRVHTYTMVMQWCVSL